MKQKVKLDILYSSLAILDCIITLSIFFTTYEFVIKLVPDGLFALLLFIFYAIFLLGGCIIRENIYLNKYYKKIQKLESRKKDTKKKKSKTGDG